MMDNKKLNISELKKLVFEQDQTTKQNKDKLFKLAKAEKDIKVIEKLRDEFGFKSAKVYLHKLNDSALDEVLKIRDIQKLKFLIEKGINVSNFNISNLIENQYTVEFIKIIIDNGGDVNKKDRYGYTSLGKASANDDRVLIKLLILNGADINIQDSEGATGLLIASQRGHYETVELLLNHTANADIQSNRKDTPLFLAAAHSYVDIVRLLVKKVSDINLQTQEGYTALIVASQNNHQSIVRLLIENGANPNIQSHDGTNVFTLPSQQGHQGIIEALIENKADINMQDIAGDTALHIASKNGHKNIVNLLLQVHTDINIQNKQGDTALILASYSNENEIVELLVENKADSNIESKDGNTALGFAFYNHNKDLAKLLIKSGAYKMPSLFTNDLLNDYLESAIVDGATELIEPLIKNGANVNDRGSNGNTPLITAANYGKLNSVDTLLKHGAILESKNGADITALWISSYRGHIDIARLLLEKGSNPDTINNDGMSALASVIGKRVNMEDITATTSNIKKANDINVRIARLLLSNNADIDIRNANDTPILLIASRIGDLEMVDLLLDHGAKVNIQENTGSTALMAASFANHIDVCKKLLEYEADVNLTSINDKSTALSNAIQNNNLKMVKLMVKHGANLSQESVGSIKLTPFGAHPNDIRCGTPLELAKEWQFTEIEIFLYNQIKVNEENKKNTSLPKGNIRLKNNLSIDIYQKYLLLKSIIDNEIFENRYNKNNKNLYYNEKKGYISIRKNCVEKKSLSDEIIQYNIENYTGEILDINNNHNPKRTVKLLSSFTRDTPIKYTTHSWELIDIKSEYGGFDGFLKSVDNYWKESLKEEIFELVPHLHDKIEEFLDAWKRKDGLKEWCDSGEDPREFEDFEKFINDLKQKIQIRRKSLKKIFIEIKKRYKSLKIKDVNLKDREFYTDREKLEGVLNKIFYEINEREEKLIEVEAIDTSTEKYIELIITHIDSYSDKDADTLLKKAEVGDFSDIKKALSHLCDWSIENSYAGKHYRVNYLVSDNSIQEIESLGNKPKGFTHRMRFYR